MVGGGGVMVPVRVWVVLVLTLGLLGSGVVGAVDESVLQTGGGGVPLGSGSFVDVPVGHWADEAVGWAVSNGVMEGVGGGRFDLDGLVPRWQIVAALFGAFGLAGGVREAGGGLGSDVFVDVPVGHVADVEVGWAVSGGITRGVGGGRFDLDGSVTRAQIVTFLSRLSGLLGGPVGDGGLGSGSFVDVPVGHWADEAVGWAVSGGITRGVGGGRFDLDRVVSRAQIATFLFRVVGLVEESRVGVTVREVDLAHVDPGEVVVGLGLEDPVGVGGELVGAARSTGLAVVTDGEGRPQGLGLVVKNQGPVDLRVDYLTTAVALVFLRPGFATSDPLLTLAALWVMKDLPEIGALAEQLEADARRSGNGYLINVSEEGSEALVDAIEAYRAAFAGSNSQTSIPVPSGSSFGGGDLVLARGLDGGYGGFYAESGEHRDRSYDIPPGCNRLDCIRLSEDLDLRPVCEVADPVWEDAAGSFGVWDPVFRGTGVGSDPYKNDDGFCLGFSEADGDVTGVNLSWTGLAVPVERTGGRVSFGDSYYYLSAGYVDLPGLGDIAGALVDTVKIGLCKAFNAIKDVLASVSGSCGDVNPWKEAFDAIKGDEVGFPISVFEQMGTVRFAVVRHSSAGPNPYAAHRLEAPAYMGRLAGIYQLIHVLMPVVEVVVDGRGSEVAGALKDKYGLTEAFDRIDDFVKTRPGFGSRKLGQYLSEIVHRIITYVVAKGRSQPRTIITETAQEYALDLADGALQDLQDYQQNDAREVDVAQVAGDIVWDILTFVLADIMEEGLKTRGGYFKGVNTFVGVANAMGTMMYISSLWGYQSLGFYSLTPPKEIDDTNNTMEFVLVLDASGSMNERVREGRKIDIAVDAITKTYQTVREELGQRADVLVYQGDGRCRSIPSIRSGWDQWSRPWDPVPMVVPGGSTPTGRALQSAMFKLGYIDETGIATGGGSGEIVLVSDGESNCVPDPCKVVEDANTSVIVHTVGFLLAADDTAAEEELNCIAQTTGGVAVTVQDASTTVDIIRPLVRVQNVHNHAGNVPDGLTERYSWWRFPDQDRDGLPDKWEDDGVYRSVWQHGQIVDQESLDLSDEGATPDRKDLFVYYDWEEGADFSQEVFDNVAVAFGDAPLDDGKGITVHFIRGKEIPTSALPAFGGALSGAAYRARLEATFRNAAQFSGFDQSLWSGHSRRAGLPQLAKYLLIRHSCDPVCPFGQAYSVPGNFAVVFVGGDNWCQSVINFLDECWLDKSKSVPGVGKAQHHIQAAAVMHVLGHLLGLRHHGAENCPEADPAYRSVMSYAHTALGIQQEHGEFFLDFSRDSTVNKDWKMGTFAHATILDTSCSGTTTDRAFNDGSLTLMMDQYGNNPDFYLHDSTTLRFGISAAPKETDLANLLQHATQKDLEAFADYFGLPAVPEALHDTPQHSSP